MRLSPLRDLHRPQDLDVAPRRRQPLDARFLHQIQERRRAAVHDRHFVVRELDDDVVDADADERGQQVLDGLDRRAVPPEHRRVVHGRHVLHGRRNLDAQVRAAEDDAGIGRARLERQRDFVAGMKSDPGA